MAIRVLILEPDEELLDSFKSYFCRATDFDVRFTARGEDCISQLQRFSPHVLLMEPVLPPGMAQKVLDAIGERGDRPFVPVLVLTRYSCSTAADHPSVKQCLVKPQSLNMISDAIRRLAAEANSRSDG